MKLDVNSNFSFFDSIRKWFHPPKGGVSSDMENGKQKKTSSGPDHFLLYFSRISTNTKTKTKQPFCELEKVSQAGCTLQELIGGTTTYLRCVVALEDSRVVSDFVDENVEDKWNKFLRHFLRKMLPAGWKKKKLGCCKSWSGPPRGGGASAQRPARVLKY